MFNLEPIKKIESEIVDYFTGDDYPHMKLKSPMFSNFNPPKDWKKLRFESFLAFTKSNLYRGKYVFWSDNVESYLSSKTPPKEVKKLLIALALSEMRRKHQDYISMNKHVELEYAKDVEISHNILEFVSRNKDIDVNKDLIELLVNTTHIFMTITPIIFILRNVEKMNDDLLSGEYVEKNDVFELRSAYSTVVNHIKKIMAKYENEYGYRENALDEQDVSLTLDTLWDSLHPINQQLYDLENKISKL